VTARSWFTGKFRRSSPPRSRFGVPTYLQLVHQVEHALRLDYLKPGDQLPKVRDVVASWRSTRTRCSSVSGAGDEGLASATSQGTFIVGDARPGGAARAHQLRRSLVSWVVTVDAAGLDEDGVAALVANVLRDFRERRGGTADRRGAERHEVGGGGVNVIEDSCPRQVLRLDESPK